MRSCLLKLLSIGAFAVVGGVQQAAIAGGMPASEVQDAQPSAPRVKCTIRMNYWCIVQADAGLNMIDSGDYRIWTMTAPASKREVVTIRESKSCDTPADLRPRRKFEKDERSASGERRHTAELAISSDGACTLRVQYLAGDTELAREAVQLATYRLYLCSDGSCRQLLLKVK